MATKTNKKKKKTKPKISGKQKRPPKKSAAKKTSPAKKLAPKKKKALKRNRTRGKSESADSVVFEPKGLGARSGGQSGDLQGLLNREGADSESVDESASNPHARD
jgi:hypothetical protein